MNLKMWLIKSSTTSSTIRLSKAQTTCHHTQTNVYVLKMNAIDNNNVDHANIWIGMIKLMFIIMLIEHQHANEGTSLFSPSLPEFEKKQKIIKRE